MLVIQLRFVGIIRVRIVICYLRVAYKPILGVFDDTINTYDTRLIIYILEAKSNDKALIYVL